jgi:hypothetical protein
MVSRLRVNIAAKTAKLGIRDNAQMEPDSGNAEATATSIASNPVDAILAAHRIPGPWQVLEATGIANRIYATHDFVLRVATDHHDAIVDALTESMAAPAARQAGILTPRLIAFDNSRNIADRPFSLWERVHGETLGRFRCSPKMCEHTWRAQLANKSHVFTIK